MYDAVCITGHCNDKETLDDLRPKGKWSDLSDFGMHTGWIACTVCGCEPPNDTNYPSKFCPNCGADMRGQENE